MGGGLFHFFYFNHTTTTMARKIFTHKKHVGGMEAPRNSLELQVENCQSYCDARDSVHSYEAEDDWSENKCYPIQASMKNLINDEISKRSDTRHNVPSIVARLMGVDTLPLDNNKYVVKLNEKKEVSSSKSERKAISSVGYNSKTSRQKEPDSICSSKDKDDEKWSTCQKYGKPRPREHPQEEELQKFKKDFEAWQAARFKECSKIVDACNIPAPSLAVESGELKGLNRRHHRHKIELLTDDQKETIPLTRRNVNGGLQHYSVINYDDKLYSAPTRIVILKPGPDRVWEHEESLTSSSGTFEDRGNIEDFLEEVKERLKCELQGKNLKRCSSAVRGSGIETPFSERPCDPKQIAQNIANQVREGVTRDLGMSLKRSESTRSYKSEISFNGSGSPEFINRDTRKLFSERLRNVRKSEITRHVGTGYDFKDANDKNYWEITKAEQEKHTRSFRHNSDDDDNGVDNNRELSPRNLIRSLSAPVSGTSFGKLLLEDRNILTGVHIRRKHEATENVLYNLRNRKKEGFNFRKKVSDFRYSFSLRGRLFGNKKMQSVIDSQSFKHDYLKDFTSGPTVITNFGERPENSTEVPPSPASVCSSSHEEFWRPVENLTPISTPDVNVGVESSMPQVFREISSNLNELRRQLNELESDRLDDTTIEEEEEGGHDMKTVVTEDPEKAYLRDLLVSSGLYDGSSAVSLSLWETSVKPISNSVFEDVEERHRKSNMERGSTLKDDNEKKLERKLLLDLSNEAVTTIFRQTVITKSRFRRNSMKLSLSPPCGRKLLDSVWEILHNFVYHQSDTFSRSLDNMLANDLDSTPWSGLMDEESNALGRAVECIIIGDLVDEIVKDMVCYDGVWTK